MLSRIAIGTANWCHKYGLADTQCADIPEILGYCQSNGIDTIDTAVAYGDCLKEVNSYFNVITKITPNDELPKNRNYYAVLCHHAEDMNPVRDSSSLNGMNDQMLFRLIGYKKSGICEKIGISIYRPSELHLADKLDLVQVPYNLFDRRFEPYFEEMKRKGLEIHARSPFWQGAVFNPRKLPLEIYEKYGHFISKLKYSGDAVFQCLTFVLMNRYIDKLVLGIDSLKSLKENLSVFQNWKHLEIKEESVLLPYLWKKE